MKVLLIGVGIVGFVGILGLGVALICQAIKEWTDFY